MCPPGWQGLRLALWKLDLQTLAEGEAILQVGNLRPCEGRGVALWAFSGPQHRAVMGIVRSVSRRRDWGLGKGSATSKFSCFSWFSGPQWLRSASETEQRPRSLISPQEARLRIGEAQGQRRASCQKQEVWRPRRAGAGRYEGSQSSGSRSVPPGLVAGSCTSSPGPLPWGLGEVIRVTPQPLPGQSFLPPSMWTPGNLCQGQA